MNTLNHPALPHRQNRSRQFFRAVRKHRLHLAMILPVMCWYLLFRYGPLYGITLAFKDFQLLRGITGSPWVGLANYKRLFGSYDFKNVFTNTLVIAGLNFLFGFPAPILLALMLNELRAQKFKRVAQSLSYLPHFISWVILTGIFMELLSPSRGPVNTLLKAVGLQPVYFLGDARYFRGTLVVTNIWKTIGWNSIVYLAALGGVNEELYDAARVDGCGRWARIWHVTLPGIIPTIMIMLIMRIGQVLTVGQEKILLLYNPATYKTADVISTYIYRKGLQDFDWSYSSAVGLFNSAVNFAFLIAANWISRKTTETSLW